MIFEDEFNTRVVTSDEIITGLIVGAIGDKDKGVIEVIM